MDIGKMMKQMQAMQQNFAKAQEELAAKEYEASAGGGLVKVTMAGNGTMTKLSIDPTLVNKEEIDILEDLIMAAFNEAKKKLDAGAQDSMSGALGGMQLPPGMKLPF